MPALNTRKRQAHEQWAGSSGKFGKRIKCSLESDSMSEFSDISTSCSKNSDDSIEMWSEAPDSAEESEEEDYIKSLETFYSIFDEPSHRGDVEKRSKEVRSTQNSHLHDCLIYIFVQIKLRKAYTGDSPRNQRRLRSKQRELRRAAMACNANVLTNFLKQPVSFYISFMHLCRLLPIHSAIA